MLVLMLSLPTNGLFAQDNSRYPQLWSKLEEQEKEGRIKDALDLARQILAHADKEKQLPDYYKALLYSFKFRMNIEEESETAIISDIRSGISNAKSPAEKALLQMLLADCLQQYLNEHQYELLDRTLTDDAEEDFRLWDNRKLETTICSLYLEALSNAETLLQIPLGKISLIVSGEKENHHLLPTMYDLLAHEAVTFFSSNFSRLTIVKEAYEIVDSMLFAPAPIFMTLPLSHPDSFSNNLLTLRIFQQWMKEKYRTGDTLTAGRVDLRRIEFVYNRFSTEQKKRYFPVALSDAFMRYSDNSLKADILFSGLVQRYREVDSDTSNAVLEAILSEVKELQNKFPHTNGTKNAGLLEQNILRKDLSIQAEEAVYPGKPFKILLNYRHLKEVAYRIVELGDKELGAYWNQPDSLWKTQQNLKLIRSGKWNMPAPHDLLSHRVEVPVDALPAGRYLLLAHWNNPIQQPDSFLLACTVFQVTRLSATLTPSAEVAIIRVNDRLNGQPIAGVDVSVFYSKWDYEERKIIPIQLANMITDQYGEVLLKIAEDQRSNVFLKLKSGIDCYTTGQEYLPGYYRESAENKSTYTVHFFTDRAIYRPGQRVYFKGIVTEQRGPDFLPVSDEAVPVFLLDVNRVIIDTLRFSRNEYGSFSGFFDLPIGRLNGQFRLQAIAKGTFHEHAFQVEEYKRPNFEVLFDTPEGSFKLGDSITVTGKAMAYNGASISNAKVIYSVRKTSFLPWWMSFRRNLRLPYSRKEEVVAYGETVTQADGSFGIRFYAAPDKATDHLSWLNHLFEITAEVTDVNAETQSSSTSIRISKYPLEPSIHVPDVVAEGQTAKIGLKSVNLYDKPVEALMMVEIQALEAPKFPKKDRRWEQPDRFMLTKARHDTLFPYDIYNKENERENWPVLRTVFNQSLRIKGDSTISTSQLPAGIYKVVLKVPVSEKDTIQMQSMMEVRDKKGLSPIPKMLQVHPDKKSFQPGDTLNITLQSALPSAVVQIRLMHNGKLLHGETLSLKGQPYLFRWPIDSTHRGGLEFFYDMTAQNRSYSGLYFLEVPFEPLDVLQYSWKTFRNKLEPGSSERWELTIKGKNGEAAAAELLATLYDASLDRFVQHDYSFPLLRPRYFSYGQNAIYFGSFRRADTHSRRGKIWRNYADYFYPELPRLSKFGFSFGWYVYDYARPQMAMSPAPPFKELEAGKDEELSAADQVVYKSPSGSGAMSGVEGSVSAPVAVFRKNFNETAFFFPQMKTDEKGNVVLSFTMPEALTRWKLLGLAHTGSLEHILLKEEVVTTKDLTITPNKLRFFRSGDTLHFNARISNMTDEPMGGKAELHFRDAATYQIIDDKMLLTPVQQNFSAAKNGSAAVSWKVVVPQGLQGVIYEVSAGSGRFTDAESDAIPVLENRMLITESVSIYLKKKGRHSITFDRFKNNQSATLSTQSLTLEYTSNPVWYALMALPYVKEQESMSSTALFNRFYANTMAAFILQQIPQSKQLLNAWKREGDLKSALEKNPELKSVVLEATPWLRNAASETEQMQQLMTLFEEAENASLNEELIKKIREMQTSNGGLCWYPGMPDNRFLTQYFAAGFGQLIQLGALGKENNPFSELLKDMLQYLDNSIKEDLEAIQRLDSNWLSNDHLGYFQTHYLYIRSFFKDVPLAKGADTAYMYFLRQAYQFGIKKDIYSKGMLAIVISRDDKPKEAARLLESLKQNAVMSAKEGMYWKAVSKRGYWYEAPISIQSMMIQAFSEVAKDNKTVDALKIWLIRQKQAQSWGNSRATADACYALLLTGGNWKAIHADPINVGGKPLKSDKEIIGLGYQKQSWYAETAKQELATVEIRKSDNHPSWGAMYWQYLEDMDKVTGAGDELRIQRKLYKVVQTDAGETLLPAAAATIHTGDKLRIKLEITASRDMEFVHLQDSRGAGMEPVEVISGYQYQGGLWYYKVTGDAATHWYVERLNKGIYTLEYSVFAASAGQYVSGVSFGECLYAPEFRAHTNGERVSVAP
jgi:hypothetical protein